jgi:Sec-independent protein translocase protein TatA
LFASLTDCNAESTRILIVFGIGVQETVSIGLLFLVILGPNERPVMARDLRRFVSGARNQLDEYKSEITSTEEENRKDRHRES